jgi:glycosyltransferase involved in cell wall biosynthesis
MDEFYLDLFCKQYKNDIHILEIKKDDNILFFYDNEDLEEKIRQKKKNYIFLLPLKSKGRANSLVITNYNGNRIECTVNLQENYLFNNYSYEFARLTKIDGNRYQVLWSNNPEIRDALDIETYTIVRTLADGTIYTSPIISIVMPIYNVHPYYLKESIDSILKQSFGDFELLIVGDNSTELQGVNLLKTYKDPRIRLISNTHDFIASLNNGIAKSKGKYIVRMNGNDILPNRLAVQYEFMEEHPEIDICGSWMIAIGNKSDIIHTSIEHEKIITSMLLTNPMTCSTVILRKSSLCKNEESLYKSGYTCVEDYKLWTDLAIKGFRFTNIAEILLKVRYFDNPVANLQNEGMYHYNLKVQMEYVEQVMQKIIEKDEKYFNFFEHIINLFNESLISPTQISNIVYQIYSDIVMKI